jgi:hypothetical protein
MLKLSDVVYKAMPPMEVMDSLASPLGLHEVGALAEPLATAIALQTVPGWSRCT